MQGEQEINRPRQGPSPSGPRRPDLRPDILDQLDLRHDLANGIRHTQGEPPGIDQHHNIRALSLCIGDGFADAFHHAAIGFHRFQQAKNGQFGDIKRTDNTLLGHARATDTKEGQARIRRLPAQFSDQAGPQSVAGGLGGHNHDALSVRHGHIRKRPDRWHARRPPACR